MPGTVETGARLGLGRRLAQIRESRLVRQNLTLFAGGLYAYVRHPRYTGMFCAVAGAALLAGTKTLWIILGVWCLAALLVIRLEERELEARFGAAYSEYRRRVPAFLPFKF